MKVRVQVVTITDDGQEITKDIACVERQELSPETLGKPRHDFVALRHFW